MKKILALILALMMAAALLPAIAEEDTPAEQTTEAVEETAAVQYDYDHVTVAVVTPLTGNFFTSMWGNNSSDLDVRNMIHGYNLVEWDGDEGLFIANPTAVSSISILQEANGDLTFIVAIQNDLVYSDGTPITAWNYAFSMLLTMAPEMAKLEATVRTPTYISGYEDYASGVSGTLAGVKVTDDYILNITIKASYLPFFYELGLLDCNPYPISVIAPGVKVADDGEGVYLTNADANVAEPVFTAELLRETILNAETGYRTYPSVTSGPYKLVSYENGEATFEINPNFKGDFKGQKPTIRNITMKSMTSEEMLQAFADGSVTVLNKLSDKQAIQDGMMLIGEQEQDMLTSANYPRSGLSFITFNTEREPMNDPAVRQAIAYLTDRQELTTEAVGMYGTVANGYYGIGQWMYQILAGTIGYPVTTEDEDGNPIPQEEIDKETEAWEALSLDDIEKYDRDVAKAAELLDAAGWNLNEAGEAYTDGVRYKQTEEGLVALKLTLAYGAGSAAGEALENALVAELAEAGIELTVEGILTETMLGQYYRLATPQYDMFFLATNFDVLYDPSVYFQETADGHHIWVASGLEADSLWEKTVAMRKTEPGDVLGYVTAWLEFEKEFAAQVPAIPVYSNVYFDFYPQVLHEYTVSSNVSWPQAIIGAYMADYVPEEPAEENVFGE